MLASPSSAKECKQSEIKNSGQKKGARGDKESTLFWSERKTGESKGERKRKKQCSDKPKVIAEVNRNEKRPTSLPVRRSEGNPVPEDPTTLLRDQVVARYTVADFRQAQGMDIVIGTLKRLMKNPKGNLSNVPKSLREGIKAYFLQAKDRLYLNGQGILCLRRRPTDCNKFFNHSMVLMPQMYQAEILYQAHNEMGHQGVNKVVARIQQRHDWMGLQLAVNKWINACMTCQQRKNPAGPVKFALQNIVSHKFNELVQFVHVKICKSKRGNRYILVIIDHFTKYAEAVPCNAQEMTAEATVRKILNTWFARHGTPSIMQSDNGPQFVAEVAKTFMGASQLTQAHSTAHHPATNGLVERQNKTLIKHVECFL